MKTHHQAKKSHSHVNAIVGSYIFLNFMCIGYKWNSGNWDHPMILSFVWIHKEIDPISMNQTNVFHILSP